MDRLPQGRTAFRIESHRQSNELGTTHPGCEYRDEAWGERTASTLCPMG